MYKNNFVVTILSDGYTQKEINGKVYLPFDTEYQIRLKNKNNRRALAEVYIDGINIANNNTRFMINSNSYITLERFFNGSLNEGPRFKFVEENHPEVEEFKNSKNGLVTVKFFLEKENIITVQPLLFKNTEYYTVTTPSTDKWKIDFGSGTSNGNSYDIIVEASSYASFNSCSSDLTGATIGGTKSNQRFSYLNLVESIEIHPTILELKLVSSKDIEHQKTYRYSYCYNCGTKTNYQFRFCPNCGIKLK